MRAGAAIAEERKRAEEAKSPIDLQRLEEQAKAEWFARTEDLRKAIEEARLGREAAKAAEEQRIAALKAADEATRRQSKRLRQGVRRKVPTIQPRSPLCRRLACGRFDGRWKIDVRSETCAV